MSTEKTATTGSLIGELFQTGLYKVTQGRHVRQVTGAALALTFVIGAWRFYLWYSADETTRVVVSSLIAVLGMWFSFRIVNYPKFADFLIAVEAEMNKVSWPSRSELVRSSTVVIFVIVVLSGILFGFDLFWTLVFKALRIKS